MTKAAWFNQNGRFNFWDSDQQPGEAELADGYVKADVDENIAMWRHTYNFETKVVDVYNPSMSNSDAEAQVLIDQEAIDKAAAEAEAAGE